MTSIPEYSLRRMPSAEIEPLWESLGARVFDNDFFHVCSPELISVDEHRRMRTLAKNIQDCLRIDFGAFCGDEFVACIRAVQRSAGEMEIFAAAVDPAHRRRGLYARLLEATIETATAEGVQTIVSLHNASHNDVIVPTLKAGFRIVGLEVVDVYGTMVKLAYHVNETRRHLLDVRSGLRQPNLVARELLGL